MGGGGPNPPVNPPTPLPAHPAPPVAPGVNSTTDENWFAKFCNLRELANGDHFEQVHGLRITLALSMKTDLCLGWYHGSVFGGSLTNVIGQDTKLNLGGYVGFIGAKKTEITKGDKVARVFAGVKISHVTGRKEKFQGANELSNSAIEAAELARKSADYYGVRSELEKTLREHVKNLELEHTSVSNTITTFTQECSRHELEVGTGQVEASSLAQKSDTVDLQCQSVKQSASADFKILADSSTELLASGKWSGYCRGDVKLMASSLQKFAASISKLG